jgi:hypothetical protein
MLARKQRRLRRAEAAEDEPDTDDATAEAAGPMRSTQAAMEQARAESRFTLRPVLRRLRSARAEGWTSAQW